MTKQQLKGVYKRYRDIPEQGIYDVYKNPSDNKINAYYRCVSDMNQHCGRNGSIVSYNCMHFTYGYITDEGFTYITYANSYFISWEDIYK